MAKRRMFSSDVVDNDQFLDMPVSARCLYYDLGMRADDDGFISPKKVLRLTSASDDDLRILISKNFVIPFETGVIVIRDWRMNNYIQKDRYTETIYKEEKKKLSCNDNGSYILDTPVIQNVSKLDTPVIQNVSKLDTQVRLGKVRLGKVRLGNNISINKELSEVVDTYNKYFRKELTSTKGFEKNYLYWKDIHSLEKIKKAIENSSLDKFWKDKMTPTILFRQKNSNGEPVDYIEDLSNRNPSLSGGSIGII